jgi:hypothetical protein
VKLNDRVYFSFYIKENIIIFDIYEYIQQLGAETVDYLYNWSLFKDGKVIFKTKMVKSFLENKIKNDVQKVLNHSNKINCDVLCFFNINSSFYEWTAYFDDTNKFIEITKKLCKKNLPNFIENKHNALNFKHKKGSFFDIPCLIPSGEEEEALQVLLKKIK